jgi:hypothetical protein
MQEAITFVGTKAILVSNTSRMLQREDAALNTHIGAVMMLDTADCIKE